MSSDCAVRIIGTRSVQVDRCLFVNCQICSGQGDGYLVHVGNGYIYGVAIRQAAVIGYGKRKRKGFTTDANGGRCKCRLVGSGIGQINSGAGGLGP